MINLAAHESNELKQDGIIRGIVRVVDVIDDVAFVEPENKSACHSCAMSKGCGTKMISGFFSSKMRPLKIENVFDACIGDRVEVGMENATILKLSAIIYIIPLLGMTVAGLYAASRQFSDMLSLFTAFLGLFAGFLISKKIYQSDYIASSVALIFFNKLAPLRSIENGKCQTEVRL